MSADYFELTDEQLAKAGGPLSVIHLLYRLKASLIEQANATNALTERIRRLNLWLLWFTIAIFALTVVQVLNGLGILRSLR